MACDRAHVPRAVVAGAASRGQTHARLAHPRPPRSPSAAATAYLNSIIELARVNSINRLTIDWTAYRNAVFAEAGSAQTIAELMPAIRVAITLLRDGHSSYRSASGATIFVALRSCSAPRAGAARHYRRTSPRSRSAHSAARTEQANAYARQIQNAISAADRDDLIGWIVDLRSNGGGNMWPMIAGLGPILGEGPLGYFIGPTGSETVWEYRERRLRFRKLRGQHGDARRTHCGASAAGRGAVGQSASPARVRRR